MARTKAKGIPPSRKKYEYDNPVVSFRVPRKDYGTFITIREKLGMSHGDVYKAGLGVIQVKIKAEEEVRREAYDEGWEKGVEQAAELYEVPSQCSKCGEEMIVQTQGEKDAIKAYMRQHGWAHAECLKRRR